MKKYSWDKLTLSGETKELFDLLLNKNLRLLEATFSQTRIKLHEMIDLVNSVIEHSIKNKWADIEYIWKTIGFMLHISLDLKTSGELLLKENDYDKEKIIIRYTCMLLYESIEDLEELLGGKFSKILMGMGVDTSFLQKLKDVRKIHNDFKNIHFNDLKEIRNIISAHRDHDFQKYNNTYKTIEKTSIMRLIIIYDSILNNIGKVMTEIMNETSRIETQRTLHHIK